MIRTLIASTALITLSQSAMAQSCPPGASTAASIAAGTEVKVIGLSTEDAYYDEFYAEVIGTQGTVTDGLTNNDGCWYGGNIEEADGSSRYYYKVALSVAGDTATGVTVSTTACPSGALARGPDVGTFYTVLGIHPDDAYNGSTTVSIGESVTFTDAPSLRDGCWISGAAETSSGASLYFFKVAVRGSGDLPAEQPPTGLVTSTCPPGAARGTIAGGTSVRILAVHPDDAYATGTTQFQVGDTIIATANMNNNGDCWYGGAMTVGGDSLYFYKGAFEVIGGGDKPSGGPTGVGVVAQMNAVPADDALDSGVETILLGHYDRSGNGTLDTFNEVNRIPCDVLVAMNRRYEVKWSNSVRTILGFVADYIWVGGAIGFEEPMRVAADRRLAECGISP